jgi:hypothetical protein
MKKKILALASILTITAISTASAQTIAQWTFEINTPADLPDSATIGGIAADFGVGTASGVHASAATDWTTPAGNGSANSLSANTWAVGDYFQFTLSTVGYSGIGVSFDQTGSNTGPRDFDLSYSTDGSSFTSFATYSLINGGWSSGAPTALPTSYSFDLSSIGSLDNAGLVYFRLVNNSTTSISGATVATGGTGRIDNFTVSVVPEPASGALIGLGLLALVARRRLN